MSARHAGRAVRGAAAMLMLVAITAGLPLLLYRVGGSPIPARLPSLHRITFVLLHKDNGSLFIGAIKYASWLAWAAFTLAVLAEAQATLRGRTAPRLHLAGVQGVAARLVAVASMTFTTPVAVSLATSPALAATPVAVKVHVEPATIGPHAAAAARDQPAITLEALVKPGEPTMHESGQAESVSAAAAHRTVVVRSGDCLWTIAQRYLGSGDRYPALVRLNLAHDMGDGRVFTDPSLIMPGWRLRLPGNAAPADPGSQTHRQHQEGHQHHDGHASGDRRFGEPHQAAGGGAARSQGTGSAGGPQAAGSGNRPSELAAGQHEEVQQAVLFTLGMLAGAALVTLERLRHRQRQHRRPGRRIALPTNTDGQRIEQKLRAAAPPAPPASLRDALCDLSEGVGRGGDPLPPIVGIHLTADRIDVLLSAPAAGPPPAPFTTAPGRQGMCWTADLRDASPEWTTAPLVPGEVGDLLPGLFTAGAVPGGGYLLLDLEAMRVTCCDGPLALTDRLLVTAATELASSRWSGWYDLVLVGCDELDVLGRAERCRDLDEALDMLEARTRTIARRLAGDRQADVRTRRMEDPEDEDWGLTLLVSRLQPTPEQMARLLDLADGPGGIAALVAGDIQADNDKLAPAVFRLEPDPGGPGEMIATVALAYLGPQHQLTVLPQTLTVSEYEALAGLFTTAAATSDVAPEAEPYGDYGGPPWMRYAAAPVLSGTDDELTRPIAFPEPGELPDPPEFAERDELPQLAELAELAGLSEPGELPDDGELSGPGKQPETGDPADPDGRRRSQPRHQADEGPAQRSQPQPEADEGLGQRPQPWRHERRPAPRHRAPCLSVNVLGPFEVLGSAEPLQPKQAELLLALALHAPVGLSNSALCGLLGADADHPRPPDSVRQLITRTRRRLGQAADDQEYIIHLGSGIYVLHDGVRLDWADFSTLARPGRADRTAPDLRAALELVRGQPFAECYHWWIDIALFETMRAEIVDTADLLAQLELAAGDPQAARRAARIGLSAESAAEQLWRAVMRAEHEAGNPQGVTEAWTSCLDAIAEIAPGGEPHPDTERLFHQLSRGGQPLSLHR